MLRTLLLVIALVIVIGIVLVATHVINLSQDANGTVTLKTNDVSVGTAPANVTVPVVRMETQQVQVPSVTVGNQANVQ